MVERLKLIIKVSTDKVEKLKVANPVIDYPLFLWYNMWQVMKYG